MQKEVQNNGANISEAEIYGYIVKMAEYAGWTVREHSVKKVGRETQGYIDIDKSLIVIVKEQSDYEKMLTIAHEFFGHAHQITQLLSYVRKVEHKKNDRIPHDIATGLVKVVITPLAHNDKAAKNAPKKIKYYSRFFLKSFDEYCEKDMKIIKFCELEASRLGRNQLSKIFGYDKSKIIYAELSDDYKNHLKESWKNHYFS